MPIERTI